MEAEFLDWLRHRITPDDRLAVAIGDDAAVLSPAHPPASVLCVDTIVDGIDFQLGQHPLSMIGRKGLAINLSDLAAMCATPVAALVSLTVPPTMTLEECKQIYEGLLSLADEYTLTIAGGDFTVASSPLSLSVTLAGTPPGAGTWLRSGAQAGDAIVVTGTLGGSILDKHMSFRPRVDEARTIAEHCQVHAATDISDGLLRDLGNIAEASGLAVHLELDAIPVSPAAELRARESGLPPLEHALADGEDFELLMAISQAEAVSLLEEQPIDCGLSCIGSFHAGDGLHTIDTNGDRQRVEPRGFQHGNHAFER